MDTKKVKKCFHCKRGCVDYPADGLFKGMEPDGRPFKGYLCFDHVSVILEDGGDAVLVSPISKRAWKERMEDLWTQYKALREQDYLVKAFRVHKKYIHAQDMAGLNS